MHWFPKAKKPKSGTLLEGNLLTKINTFMNEIIINSEYLYCKKEVISQTLDRQTLDMTNPRHE